MGTAEVSVLPSPALWPPRRAISTSILQNNPLMITVVVIDAGERVKIGQCLFALTFLCVTAAQSPPTASRPDASAEPVQIILDRAARRFLAQNRQAVGLSVGVIANGRTYRHTFGRARRNQPYPPALDTLYPIASISKTFTGALIARAQTEHRLLVSDDVRTYLKGNYPNLELGGKFIRLFDLLDHRSGLPFLLPDRPETLPDYTASSKSWNERVTEIGRAYGKSEFLADLHAVALRSEPGTSFRYSNAGAQLAGYVLEHVYSESFENILQQKLLGPLHMAHTTIAVPRHHALRLAVGYDAAGREMAPVPDWLQGAGAIKSTLGDMLEYMKWQLAETDAAVKLSHQPVWTQGAYSAALNWQILRTNGRRIVWQEGNVEGFNSLCILEPELGIGLVILANEEDPKSAHGYTIMANDILHALNVDAVLLPTG